MSDDTDTPLYFNGQRVTEQELFAALDEVEEYTVNEEMEIVEKFGVSINTASIIVYLRSRSRWTLEKEKELIDRDKAGNPISSETVLSGEF